MCGLEIKKGMLEVSDMIWPRKCSVCGGILNIEERHICAGCLADMPYTFFWSWRENPAERYLWVRTYLQGVICLFYYSKYNNYSHLLHLLKYQGETDVGIYLGTLLGTLIRDHYPMRPDVLVPVPIHWRRKWKRGYNQSEIIARGISAGMGGVPIRKDLLSRTTYSTSQTKTSVTGKWDNVKSAFAFNRKADLSQIQGQHLLLVDDVLTTGATAEACYDQLCNIPQVKISFASLGFAHEN